MMATFSDKKLIHYLRTSWGKQDPNEIVEEIAKGKSLPIHSFLISGGQQQQQENEDKEDYRTALVKAGAIDRIFEFLRKSDETFESILAGAGDDDLVQCPSMWLQVVSCVSRDGFLKPPSLQKEIQFKVVNNIQEVFQNVSNFEERKLFGRRDSWIRSLLYLLALLRNLLTSENPEMAEFLIKMMPIKLFMVRMLYMELGGIQPAVLDEIREFETSHKMKIIGYCQSYAAFTIKTVTEKMGMSSTSTEQKKSIERDKSKSKTVFYTNALLGEFSGMPVGPGQELMLGPGILKLLETSKSDGWYEGGYSSTMFLFLKLYDWTGRLSGKFGVESVSSSLVPICRDHLLEFASKNRTADKYFLENVTAGLVVLGASLVTPVDLKGRQAPIDYNVASAIYNGLLQYCCDICDACNDGRFVGPLTKFLQIVLMMAKFPLTKKAIVTKLSEIRAKIERVKERPPYLFSCLPIIEKIVSTAVHPSGDDGGEEKTDEEIDKCEFCNEKCGKDNKTKKKCPFCRSVIYCSSDCLRLNHILHQQSCLLLRKYPAPALSSAQIVEKGKELFATHLQKILLQASLKGFSILFCFVVIDMAEATPLFRILTPEQFFQSYSILEEDIIEQTKETFERNKANGSLTVSMIGFFEDGLSISFLTFPPDAAPTHSHFGPSVMQAFETDKWTAAQRQVASMTFRTPGGVKKLQSNPQMWRASIMKSMKP